ncbi:MAG: PQQ-binding-like beta-propeller repeat protein [Pirellulales bacterium]
MRCLFLLCVIAFPILADRAAHAQGPATLEERDVRIDEADVSVRAQLARAEQAVRESQWDEAVEALLSASDTASDRLVLASQESDLPGGGGFRRYVPVGRYVQMQLQSLGRAHPPLLQRYRQRVDAQAQKQLEAARLDQDLAAWEGVVRNFEHSRVGTAALWEYGERLLERGELHRARAVWERIEEAARTVAPDAPGGESTSPRVPVDRSWWWTFAAAGRLAEIADYDARRAAPTSLAGEGLEASPADLSARLTLVSILEANAARVDWELTRFQRRFPAAQGRLAGKAAPWPQLLADQWKASRETALSTGLESGGEWRQFGHDLGRSTAVARALDPAGRPRWQTTLRPLPMPTPRGDSLPFHPLAIGDRIVVQDARGVRAWNAETGEAAVASEESGLLYDSLVSPQWLESPNVRVLGRPLFPLASDGSIVWARCGAPWASADEPIAVDQSPARIVGLDLAADGRAIASWTLEPPEFGPEWTWEGPPVVRQGRAYAGLRRSDSVQTQAHVGCWEASSGRLLWKRMIAAATTPRARRSLEWTQNLVTWHEGRLFYHAEVGAAACLDPRDGAIEWLVQYPRAAVDAAVEDREAPFRRRELTPCIAHHDVIIAAPADDGQIFALEAATGRLIWSCSAPAAAESTHVLGVADGCVVASGQALLWIDATTGRVRAQFPPAGSLATGIARPGPHGYGRGFIAGDEVWWPTHDQIFVFHARPAADVLGGAPRAVRQIDLKSRGATGGNLMLHRGMLYIASPDTLYAFGE